MDTPLEPHDDKDRDPRQAVEAFRRQTGGRPRRPIPLPARDKLLVGSLGLALIASSWMLGNVRIGSQFVLLGFAVVSFLLLFLPMPDIRGEVVRSAPGRENWHRLLRFPLFWIGLGLMLYITVQGLNPRVEFGNITGTSFYQFMELEHVEWLPSSVKVPLFESLYMAHMNPWRMLIMLGAAWLILCSVAVGFRRRRAFVFLLWIASLNALALAILGVAQHITQADEMFWLVYPGTKNFWATFPYGNHGTAYLNLGVVASLALAVNYIEWSQSRMRATILPALTLLMALVIAASVFIALGKMSMVLVVIVFVLYFLLRLILLFRGVPSVGSLLLEAGALVGIGVAGIGLFNQLDEKQVYQYTYELKLMMNRLDSIEQTHRYQFNRMSMLMIKDRPWYGSGAGSYRYQFFKYRKDVPHFQARGLSGRPISAKYAHNDFLHFLIELGLVGFAFLVFGFFYWFFRIVAMWRGARTFHAMIFFGLGVVSLQALIDFPFFNGAFLTFFMVLSMGLLRHMELQDDRYAA